MSIMDQMESLDGAQAPEVVPENEEYKIRIISVTADTNKNGDPYIIPKFEVSDHPLAKDFTKYLHVPTKDLANSDRKKFERTRWAMVEFFECFGIDPQRPGDEESWVGREGWAILGVSEDEQYGEQNYVKKFIGSK